jgi:predicted transcriptional regulator
MTSLPEHLYHTETLAAIHEGMASAERGELKPAMQVLDEMRATYGLPVSLTASNPRL